MIDPSGHERQPRVSPSGTRTQQHRCKNFLKPESASVAREDFSSFPKILFSNMYANVLSAFTFVIVLQSIASANLVCPDQKSECPDRTTCCQLPTKQWGCCPIVKATCCSDGLHCCPEKTTCNLQEMSCDNSTGRVSWLETRPLIFSKKDDILCPDGKKTCQSGNTCCKMGDPPDWGCCQFPHAVCCSDHVHCCPHDNVCNGSKCLQGNSAKCTFLFTVCRIETLLETTVKCQDGSACPKGNTCCLQRSGRWGCCPFANGICCSDQSHCCESGTTCDQRTGHCVNVGSKIKKRKWVKKFDAILISPVICPDQESQCPESTTCCEMGTGEYGCCPMPEAVCCEDKIHCCPSGTTCDIEEQKCNKGSRSKPWQEKIPAYPINDIVCPDHKSQCPNGATCCAISETQFGCCPLPQAVCCEDKEHCCPTGTTCDVEQEACISALGTTFPWFLKFKPQRV